MATDTEEYDSEAGQVQRDVVQRTYENEPLMQAVKAAIEPHLEGDEMLIWRGAFRWRNENGMLPNHYECQDARYLCETFGYELVHDFNHVAIVRCTA